MAHIPMGDIEELWNSSQHSWHGLHQNLEGRVGKSEGISNNLVEDMIGISKQMEQSGQSFPSSPEQLYNVLNQHLPQHQ